jgi:hypothetical protein
MPVGTFSAEVLAWTVVPLCLNVSIETPNARCTWPTEPRTEIYRLCASAPVTASRLLASQRVTEATFAEVGS